MQRNQKQFGGQRRGQMGGGQGQMSGGQTQRGRQQYSGERGNQSQAGRQGYRGENPYFGQSELGTQGRHSFINSPHEMDDDQNEYWNPGQERYPETSRGMYRPNRAQDDRYESMSGQLGGGYGEEFGMQSHELLPYREGRYGQGQDGRYGMGGNEGRFGMGGNEGRFGMGQESRFGTGQEDRYGLGGQEGRYGQGSERQSFFGKGPKGYKRSDERIKEDVSDRIAGLGHIDATDVEVSVSNGEVTLSGNIPDRNMKYELEHLILSVVGVNDVTNQLRVKREEHTGTTTGRGSKGSSDENQKRGSSANSGRM